MQAVPRAGALALALGCLLALALGAAALSEDYYSSSCPTLNDVVRDRVKAALERDISVGGAILRMLLHDCFVRGCDASILLLGNGTERSAGPNTSVRGDELIEDIKGALQGICPDVVSCADIEVLAAKQVIYQMGGPVIGLRLGRRDGTESILAETNNVFPGPSFSVQLQRDRLMQHMSLDLVDLVALSGAHTIGRGHCQFVQPRWESSDPTMDAAYRESLKARCLQDNGQALDLDVTTPIHFDNQYFKNLLANKGLLTSDQVFALDGESRPLVELFANHQESFFNQFTTSFIKMTEVKVLEAAAGEIRRVCSARN